MGFEALSRWRNPESGDISPAVFIPLAEQHGLLAELTMRQINHLALDAPLLTQRFDQVALAFNLSATLLGHGGIQDALARRRPWNRLCRCHGNRADCRFWRHSRTTEPLA